MQLSPNQHDCPGDEWSLNHSAGKPPYARMKAHVYEALSLHQNLYLSISFFLSLSLSRATGSGLAPLRINGIALKETDQNLLPRSLRQTNVS
jgi:hypothetical protein